MNSSAQQASVMGQWSGWLGNVVRPAAGRSRLILVVAAACLLAGAQSWLFSSKLEKMDGQLRSQLMALRFEATSNQRLNATLQALQVLWRTSTDEARKRQLLGLRDSVLQSIREDKRAAIAELLQAIQNLGASLPAEDAALALLRREAALLAALYEDAAARALDFYQHPPLYLQPTAFLLGRQAQRRQALQYDQAVFLLLTEDSAAAKSLLDELRRAASDTKTEAQVLYALARLQYSVFENEKDARYLQESLDLTRQSLVLDDSDDLPGLFLDFLISVEQKAIPSEQDTPEGEGTGEGKGERGVTATDPGEF